MNFRIDNEILTKTVNVITKVIPQKTSFPAIESVLITRDNNDIILTTTDMDIFCSVRINPTSIEGDSPLLLPHQILMDAVKSIGNQSVSFKEEDKAVRISWTNGQMVLPLFDVSDYPTLPDMEQKNSISIPASIIATAIQRTSFATANDEMRPIMNGIRFDIKNNQFTIVGTDSRKLIFYDATISTPEPFEFTMSNKMTAITNTILSDEEMDGDQQFRIQAGTTRVGYSIGEYTVTGSSINGRYPDYRGIIPQQNNSVLTIKRMDFINTLMRMNVFANNKTTKNSVGGAIKLELNEIDGVEISAQNTFESKCCAKERLEDAAYHGDNITIGLNIDILLSILRHRVSTSVNLSFSDARHAVLITDIQEEGNQFEPVTSIMMPQITK